MNPIVKRELCIYVVTNHYECGRCKPLLFSAFVTAGFRIFFFFFRLLFGSRSVSPTRLNFLHWALLSSVNSTCLELPFHR